MLENRYIVVEGVIGAGKTSLARLLAERLQAKLVLEEVEENPFLKDFYRDRHAFAFQTQMHFLFSRYQQQRSLRQMDLFNENMVGWLEMDVMKPDVTVYLQATSDTLMDRITRRGRPYEREIDRGYLNAL